MQCLGLLCFAMCGVCCPVGLNALPRDISVQKGNICYIGMLIISHPSVTLRFVKMLSISNFQHTKMFGIKKVFFFTVELKTLVAYAAGRESAGWVSFLAVQNKVGLLGLYCFPCLHFCFVSIGPAIYLLALLHCFSFDQLMFVPG
jgi:hypothetical protein